MIMMQSPVVSQIIINTGLCLLFKKISSKNIQIHSFTLKPLLQKLIDQTLPNLERNIAKEDTWFYILQKSIVKKVSTKKKINLY